MSEKETKFPCLNQHIRKDYPVITDAVDDWIKRCMADKPHREDADNKVLHDSSLRIEKWFDKWFGQFKENKTP